MTRPTLLPARRAAFAELPTEAQRDALALRLHARRCAAGLAALEALAPLERAALEAGTALPPQTACLPADRRFRLCRRVARRALAGASAEPEGLRCHGVWAAPRWARGLPLLGERAGLVFYGAA